MANGNHDADGRIGWTIRLALSLGEHASPTGIETHLLRLEHNELSPVAYGLVLISLMRHKRNAVLTPSYGAKPRNKLKGLRIVA